MSFFVIVAIAFGLAMDAFAVSVTNGMTLRNARVRDAFNISLCFGLFQAVMPLIGWLLGMKFEHYITRFDHWIAFFLLALLGAKMIYEALKEENKQVSYRHTKENTLDNKKLLLLGIATSIDALAVGVSFAFLNISILNAIVTIGLITFATSFIGVFIGKKCGDIFKNYAEIIGGIILILIGIKILIEHTTDMIPI